MADIVLNEANGLGAETNIDLNIESSVSAPTAFIEFATQSLARTVPKLSSPRISGTFITLAWTESLLES